MEQKRDLVGYLVTATAIDIVVERCVQLLVIGVEHVYNHVDLRVSVMIV